jgi:ribosome maturation factor RimP
MGKENMIVSKDIYKGIRRALEFAEQTGQSVNVFLNRGDEGEKIEGVIKEVDKSTFRIRLLLDSGQLDGYETIAIPKVEYVEYS